MARNWGRTERGQRGFDCVGSAQCGVGEGHKGQSFEQSVNFDEIRTSSSTFNAHQLEEIGARQEAIFVGIVSVKEHCGIDGTVQAGEPEKAFWVRTPPLLKQRFKFATREEPIVVTAESRRKRQAQIRERRLLFVGMRQRTRG